MGERDLSAEGREEKKEVMLLSVRDLRVRLEKSKGSLLDMEPMVNGEK